jgi:LDH2 family malate/lactate/ureidoglycolate dehydrogenase
VLAPGEPEAEAERRADREGIAIDLRHHDSLVALGERFSIPFRG